MIITWFIWIGIVLLVQGIHVFRVGRSTPFFLPNIQMQPLPGRRRLLYGLVATAAAAMPLVVGIRAVIHMRASIAADDLIWAAVMGIPGIWFLIRPATMIEWVQHDHPDMSLDNLTVETIARVCGAVLLFIGLGFITL
jgi:hypothetical protein